MPDTYNLKPRDYLGIIVQLGSFVAGVFFTNRMSQWYGKLYSNGNVYLNANFPSKWTVQLFVWITGLALTYLAAAAISYVFFSNENKKLAYLPLALCSSGN